MLWCIMRTTLTLEPDIAVTIERLRRNSQQTLKDLVNQALRLGLQQLEIPAEAPPEFHTRTFSAGRCLIGDLDNVAEALAIAEGEDFK